MSFLSRKMLCLDGRVSRGLIAAYERSNDADATTDDNARRRRVWTVERVNMNLFRFERRNAGKPPIDASAAQPMCDNAIRDDDEYSHTAALQRLISVVMQDVQQRNLNAKHASAASNATAGGSARRVDGTDCAYVQLNRSGNQRRCVELCCVVYGTADAETFRREFGSVSTVHSWMLSTADAAAAAAASDATSDESRVVSIVYGTIDKRRLPMTLARFRTLPRLVFCSNKNVLYTGGNGSALTHVSACNARERRMRLLLYVANFTLYHTYHESDRSFDVRQFGARYVHLRGLLFLLALINARLLRVNDGRNVNLALNMQSLGKAYRDAGLHIFAENSIQHVKKLTTTTTTPKRLDLSTTKSAESNSAAESAVVPRRKRPVVMPAADRNWRFPTSGLLVDRYLGRVSAVGVNATTIRRVV